MIHSLNGCGRTGSGLSERQQKKIVSSVTVTLDCLIFLDYPVMCVLSAHLSDNFLEGALGHVHLYVFHA